MVIKFRLTSSLLFLVFISLALNYSSAYALEGSEMQENKVMASEENVTSSKKEHVSDVGTTKLYENEETKLSKDGKISPNSDTSIASKKLNGAYDLIFNVDYAATKEHPPHNWNEDYDV